MILPPKNDTTCLGAITQIVRHLVDDGDRSVAALARELGSTAALVRWMRSLPQRDDLGATGDGPKVATCAPPQRLRIPASDPNCVERAAGYLAVAELLDPGPHRCLATIRTPAGLHTIVIENNQPVVLDPQLPRNAVQAAVDALCGTAPPTTARASAAWLCQLAAEPAAQLVDGPRAVRNARAGFAAVVQGGALPREVLGEVSVVLALAAREAARWGPAGIAAVDRMTRHLAGRVAPRAARLDAPATTMAPASSMAAPAPSATPIAVGAATTMAPASTAARASSPTATSTSAAPRRWRDVVLPRVPANLSAAHRADVVLTVALAERRQPGPAAVREVAPGRYGIRPSISHGLRAVARTLAVVAPAVAVPAARAALATLGVSPMMLAPVERALNREGLTLGPLVRAFA